MQFSADSPEEAAELVRLLQKRETQLTLQEGLAHARIHDEPEPQVQASEDDAGPWNAEVFQSYLRRLGDTQTTVLAHLLVNGIVTDAELRASLRLPSNQALAGVLSGLSKQARAMGIDPREVFNVQNWRLDGKRHAEYLSALSLRRIARKLNWPPDDKMFIENA